MDKDQYRQKETSQPDRLNESEAAYGKAGFVAESEEDRLLRDASYPGIEKLRSFTQMIRRNRMLRRAEESS